MKIEEFAVDGQFTVIHGNLPDGENATRRAIISAVNPKTILDAEQMMLTHDDASALMDKLRDLARDLNVKLVLHDGIVYCSEVIDGALELVRQDRQADKMITYADNYRAKTAFVGRPIGKSRSVEQRAGTLLALHCAVQNIRKDIFWAAEDVGIDAPVGKDWKQTKLRKGAGHNKHSRKGKK